MLSRSASELFQVGFAIFPDAGLLPGEQFVKNHSETEDVARGCHAFAPPLFRARVTGSHGARRHHGLVIRLRRFGIEQARDAEIEQLRFAFCGDANIGRLEIAMDDKILVRVGNGRANFAEESEPLSPA